MSVALLLLLVAGGVGYKLYSDTQAQQAVQHQRLLEQKAAKAAANEKRLVSDFDAVVGLRAEVLAAEAAINFTVAKTRGSRVTMHATPSATNIPPKTTRISDVPSGEVADTPIDSRIEGRITAPIPNRAVTAAAMSA